MQARSRSVMHIHDCFRWLANRCPFNKSDFSYKNVIASLFPLQGIMTSSLNETGVRIT